MPNRIGALLVSLLGVASALASAVPADAQSSTAGRAATFTAPRTPWGDPDISGNFSNKYELGTPFERPAEFEGRRIEDFSPAEIAELARRRQELNLLNYPHQGDPENPAGNLGGPNTWGDRFEISKGSRPWFVVEPDGRIPALTPEARQRGAGGAGRAASRTYVPGPQAPWDVWRDQQNMSLYDRCITRGLPGSMTPASYGNSYHILQTPDYVAIRYEMVHETRVIPLDPVSRNGSTPFLPVSQNGSTPFLQRPPAAPSIRQYMGIGRGRWEGNSLVVETTNLRNGYRGANAATLKYVERFTRIAPNVVEWRMTVEDATTWTRPWTFAIPLTENDNEAIVEYACHEGNRSMPLRLRAGRTAELTAADAAQKGLKVAEREFFFDEDEERLEQERAEQRKQQQQQPQQQPQQRPPQQRR
jgi:hypothetical protein